MATEGEKVCVCVGGGGGLDGSCGSLMMEDITPVCPTTFFKQGFGMTMALSDLFHSNMTETASSFLHLHLLLHVLTPTGAAAAWKLISKWEPRGRTNAKVSPYVSKERNC